MMRNKRTAGLRFMIWSRVACTTLSLATLLLSTKVVAQTVDGWRADIDLLINKIERYHPMPWMKITKEDFVARAHALTRDLPKWEKERIFIEMKKLVAMLEDGHTEVLFTNQERFNLWFPVRMERFPDGVFMIAADSLHAEFLGGKILRIGKVKTEEAFRRVGEVVPRDSKHGIDRFATDYLSNAVILKQLGVIDGESRLEMVILTSNGAEKQAVFQSAPWQMSFHWSWNKTNVPTSLKTVSVFDNRLDRLPLYLENVIPSRIPYAFKYLPDSRMLYFQFNAVNNWRKDPFTEFTQRMLKTFDDNVSNIDKFVIDLRFNEGGNGALLPPLVKEFVLREKSLGKGKLFIITGNHTFSAAPNFIGQMLQYTNVITVGDIAAGSLNWCSDVQDFLLPNSRVVVNISTMCWQRGHATDNRGYYPPDCYIPTPFKDYVSSADPILDAIKNGTAVSLKQIFLDKGVDAFLEEVGRKRSLYGNTEAWFPYTSFNLALTSYFDLAASGKTDDALKLAAWNAERHPGDFRAWYGLAEIAGGAGKTKLALEAYRKLFTIEPGIWDAVRSFNTLLVMDACESEGSNELEAVVEGMRKKDPLSVNERMLNEIGYRLLGNNKIREAVKVFKLNVKLYPNSANVYDSLGEAFLKAGEKELAKKNYEKSLELNPENASAKKTLEELRAK